MIPVNTLMTITEPAMDCLGMYGSIGRVLRVVDIDEDRTLWLELELSDVIDVETSNRMVLTVPDTWLDFCDIRQQWAERKRRRLYDNASRGIQ